MPGPIARAYVEVVGDGGDAAREIQADLRRAFQGVERIAKEAGGDITKAFRQAAAASRRALEEIDEANFGELSREAREAGVGIERQFAMAARRIEQILSTIGETAFDDLPEDARRAGGQVQLALMSAAKASEQALDRIGEGAFDDLSADARTAALRIQASLATAAQVSREALASVGEATFSELSGDAIRAAGSIADAFIEASLLSEQALETIGGDALAHVAIEAQLAAEAIVVAFAEAAAAADVALSSVEPDPENAAAGGARAGAAAGAAFVGAFRSITASVSAAGAPLGQAFGAAFSKPAVGVIGNQLHRALGNIVQATAVTSFFGLIAGAAAFLGFGVKISAEFERIQIAVQNLVATDLGIPFEEATDEAKLLELQIKQLALRTPFNFLGLSENVQQLLAAGRDLAGVVDDARALGTAGAFFGVKPDDLKFVIRALGQMAGTTRPLQQDLNQIVQRFPGFAARAELTFRAAGEAAIAAGDITAEQLEQIRARGLQSAEALALVGKGEQMLVSGAISGAEGVELLLTAMQKVPGAAEALERQARSLTGQLERLKESTQFALIESFKPLKEFLTAGDFNEATGRVDSFLGDLADAVNIGLRHMGRGITEALVDGVEGVDGVGLAQSVLDLFKAAAPSIGAAFRQGAEFLVPILDTLTDFLLADGPDLIDTFDSIAESIGEISSEGLDGALSALQLIFEVAEPILELLAAMPDEVFQLIAFVHILHGAFGHVLRTVSSVVEMIARVALSTGAVTAVSNVGGAAASATAQVGGLAAAIRALPAIAATPAFALAGIGLVAGGFLFQEWQEAKDKAAAYRAEVQLVAEALVEVAAGGAKIADALADEDLRNSFIEDLRTGAFETQAEDALRAFGLSVEEVFDKFAAGKDPVEDVEAAIRRLGFEITEAGKLEFPFEDWSETAIEKNERLAAALASLGDNIDIGDIENLLSDLREERKQLEAGAALALQTEFIDTGLFSEEEIAAAVDRWGSALATVPKLAEEAARRLAGTNFGDALDQALGEAQQILNTFGDSISELLFPTKRAEAANLGLNPLIDQVRGFVEATEGNVPTAEAFAQFARDINLSLGDAEIVFEAIIEGYEADIERFNGVLESLNFQNFLAKTDEFKEGLKSSLAGVDILSAFSKNLDAQVDVLIREAENAGILVMTKVPEALAPLRDAVVHGLGGTPEGRQALQQLVDEGGLVPFIEAIDGQLERLSQVLGVDLRTALINGAVGLDDIINFDGSKEELEALVAAVEETETKVAQSLQSLREEVAKDIGPGPGQAFASKEAEERFAHQTAAARTPADIVEQELGPVQETAKNEAEAAAEGFTQAFGTTVGAGLRGIGVQVAADISSVITGGFKVAGGAAEIQSAQLVVKLLGQGRAVGKAFGTGFLAAAALALIRGFVPLRNLFESETRELAERVAGVLTFTLSAGIIAGTFVVLAAVVALTLSMTRALVSGVLAATTAARAMLAAGLSGLISIAAAAGVATGAAFVSGLNATLVGGVAVAMAAARGAVIGGLAGLAGPAAGLGFAAGFAFGAGMASGIRAALVIIIAAAQIAAFAAAQAVQGALGIASPSKVGISLGGNFGESMALGLERSVGRISAAAGSAATALSAVAPQGLASPVAAGAAGSVSAAGPAGGGSEYHNEFNIMAPTDDPETLAIMVATRLERRLLG
jgi:hypothetical protein